MNNWHIWDFICPIIFVFFVALIYLRSRIYKVKCELWIIKTKCNNGNYEKRLSAAEKIVVARSPKNAKIKAERKLAERIEEEIRKKYGYRLNKLPGPHHFVFFVNGKQF